MSFRLSNKRVKRLNYAINVIEFIGGLIGWVLKLVISVFSLATSVDAYFGRDRMRIGVMIGTVPILGFKASVFFFFLIFI
jgi:hypothetical protein